MDLIKQINNIASLSNNWKDNGADSFSLKLINRAINIAKILEICDFGGKNAKRTDGICNQKST